MLTVITFVGFTAFVAFMPGSGYEKTNWILPMVIFLVAAV